MSLPDKGTKHIAKPQMPIGAVKGGRLKVIDGRTGKESWRQGTKGFMKDFDGDPIATNHNRAGLKNRPQHHTKTAKKHNKKYMGGRPQHEPGHSGEDSE